MSAVASPHHLYCTTVCISVVSVCDLKKKKKKSVCKVSGLLTLLNV